MKYKKILLTCIVFCFFSQTNFSQWEVGPLYNIKKNIPSHGFGVHFSRNLPYQFPDFGIKIKGELDIFQQKENSVLPKNYISSNIHFSLIGTFYTGFVQPYLGFGFGIEKFSIESNGLQQKDNITKYLFLLNSVAGLKFFINSTVYPFTELQIFKYFYNFNNLNIAQNISNLQLIGTIGIIVELNLIDKK